MWTALVYIYLFTLACATTTGDKLCDKNLCIVALRDGASATDTYTLTPVSAIPGSEFGWVSLGFGTMMGNSDMVVLWPNSDGSITLSQRTSRGHDMPTVSSPSRAATLSSDSYAASNTTSITFSIPATDTSETEVIWAYSRQNPGSALTSAAIQNHDWFGSGTLNLAGSYGSSAAAAASSASAGSSSASSDSSSGASGASGASQADITGGTEPTSTLLLAHIICGTLAALLFLPLGAVLPRIARAVSSRRWWFPVHASVQGIIGAGLVIAAYALGRMLASQLDSAHRRMGLALLVIVLFQSVLGCTIHWVRLPGKNVSGRTVAHYGHMVLGLGTVVVGFFTVWTGIWSEMGLRAYAVPGWKWKIGWIVVVCFWFVAYIVAFVLSLVRRRHYRAETGSPASEIEEKGLTAEAARSAVSPLA